MVCQTWLTKSSSIKKKSAIANPAHSFGHIIIILGLDRSRVCLNRSINLQKSENAAPSSKTEYCSLEGEKEPPRFLECPAENILQLIQ